MATWSLKLLGGFALERAGEPVELHNRKDRLLLAFLGLKSGRPVSRDKLAGLLWADRAEEQARGSLRQSLAALRGAFGEDMDSLLVAGRDSVSLKSSALQVDVEAFERAAADISTLAAAAKLYPGPLLEGFEAPSPEYDQWLLPERQRLEDLAASVVERLVTIATSQQDLAPSIRLARRLLERDRLREPVCRALMQLLARDNKRNEALKLFSQCEAALTEELGVKAGPETEKVYREILGAAQRAEPELAPAAPVEERPSIAVMPFHNISRESDLDVLCEGLARTSRRVSTGSGCLRHRPLFVG
jgi:DNA-binding SARP family transcriptional activator